MTEITDPFIILGSWLEKKFDSCGIKIWHFLPGCCRFEYKLVKLRIMEEGNTYLNHIQLAHWHNSVMIRHEENDTEILLKLTFGR